MPYGTPNEWLFEDRTLIASALREAKREDCRCYECDTLDSQLEDIVGVGDPGISNGPFTRITPEIHSMILISAISNESGVLLWEIKRQFIVGRRSIVPVPL